MDKETALAHLGCAPEEYDGVVNIPVHRASTILFPTLDAFEAAERGQSPHPSYGRIGTPSSAALENAIATLEGADHSIVTASGLAAIHVVLLAFLGAGDHVLIPDNVYGSTRRLCDQELKRLGIDIVYYDPVIGAGIAGLMKPNTRIVYVESPGSLTFEMQDIPAIAKAAHDRGAVVVADGTWATPLYFSALAHGVDVSIHSATKYIGGHSDLVMGVLSSRKQHYPQLLRAYRNTASTPAGDNCALALRGLRTMAVRLKRHEESALALAGWLKTRKEVARVLHPALPDDPGHALWKRDFTGSSGLFSVLLRPVPREALAALLDHVELYGMGYSWGGFESLMIPFNPAKGRTATVWKHDGPALRIHAGLEDPDDLIRDLEKGFVRMGKG